MDFSWVQGTLRNSGWWEHGETLNTDSEGQRLPGGDNGRAKPGRKGKKASGSMGVVKVGG